MLGINYYVSSTCDILPRNNNCCFLLCANCLLHQTENCMETTNTICSQLTQIAVDKKFSSRIEICSSFYFLITTSNFYFFGETGNSKITYKKSLYRLINSTIYRGYKDQNRVEIASQMLVSQPGPGAQLWRAGPG